VAVWGEQAIHIKLPVKFESNWLEVLLLIWPLAIQLESVGTCIIYIYILVFGNHVVARVVVVVRWVVVTVFVVFLVVVVALVFRVCRVCGCCGFLVVAVNRG
jgi:hypothetical protein